MKLLDLNRIKIQRNKNSLILNFYLKYIFTNWLKNLIYYIKNVRLNK